MFLSINKTPDLLHSTPDYVLPMIEKVREVSHLVVNLLMHVPSAPEPAGAIPIQTPIITLQYNNARIARPIQSSCNHGFKAIILDIVILIRIESESNSSWEVDFIFTSSVFSPCAEAN